MCLNGRDCLPSASLVTNGSAARRNDCNAHTSVWPRNALIGRAGDMKVCDFPKLALACCCPLRR